MHGNKCAQVTTNGKFIHVYPMASKSEAGDALSKFVQDVGIPEVVIEQVGKNTNLIGPASTTRSNSDRLSHTLPGRIKLRVLLGKSRRGGATRCDPKEFQKDYGVMV